MNYALNYALAGVFFVLGSLMFGCTLLLVQTRRRIVRNWLPIGAVIIDSNLELRGPLAVLSVVYGYHAEDVYFERAEAIAVVAVFSRQQRERLASRYSPGEPVTAYVNPDNHQAATLLETPDWIGMASFAGGLICLGIGAAALAV